MASGTENGGDNGPTKTEKRRKRRWGDAVAQSNDGPAPSSGSTPVLDSKAKALALQESVKARLAALKAKTAGSVATKVGAPSEVANASASAGLKRPPPEPVDAASQKKTKRAKHYELDLSVTAPTFKDVNKKPAKKINPYLAHKEKAATTTSDEAQPEPEEDEILDERLSRSSKPRKRNKEIKFVEPGTFVEVAERKRLKAANAERSGFLSGRKAGTYVQSSNMANIYGAGGMEAEEDDLLLAPRAEASEKTAMPSVLEWWDVEFLPSKLKKQVASFEGKELSRQTQSQMQQFDRKKDGTTTSASNLESEDLQKRCFEQASLSYSKTAALVQHIVPIKPPNANDGPEAQPTLYLTKKELKRKRKLRRQEKQRELQDMQAAGLVPPPEPRLTLKNFIQVLGDQAYLDPSQMERKVMEQIQARQRAHMERNEANKLTKEQRAEKRAKKLEEDTSKGVHVAVFYVKDMSHPYHRAKVDLNAQQYNITGGVLECEQPQLSCVICEGGPKAIKRYQRLMLVRMKWTGPDNADFEEEDDGTTQKFNPENKCELVWTGIAVKRFFKGFVFQACESSDQARKILRAKGVGHYWDQMLAHASGRGDTFQLKLADDDDDSSDESHDGSDVEGNSDDRMEAEVDNNAQN